MEPENSTSSMFMVLAYLLYLGISVGMTWWVASTLQRNGVVFLRDVFRGKDGLAEAVNHLLVVGFYLINVGYVALSLKEHDTVWTLQGVIELVCSKVGRVLLMLGGMHFFNLYVFSRIRRSAQLRDQPPPVLPQERIAVAPPPMAAQAV
jgi:hypothetical protein